MKARLSTIWVFCLLGLFSQSAGQIRIVAPDGLRQLFKLNGGRIDGSTAAFGAPYYGERILGKLVFGESMKGHVHCLEDDYDVPPADEVEHEGYSSIRMIQIVLVRRGKCSFVTKAKVARKKGAHAVIYVDKKDSNLTTNDIRKMIVADDGFGADVHIPSVLVSERDGQQLIDYSRMTGNQVVLEMDWRVPKNHVILLDMWMSSASRETQRFLKEFTSIRESLNEQIKFMPHYHIFSLKGGGQDYNEACTGTDGSFCAEDPDGSGPVTGKDVVEEDIRQLCIHDVTKVRHVNLDDTSIAQKAAMVEYSAGYWAYVSRFGDACPIDGSDEDKRFGKACSERLMADISEIDIDKVKKCVRETTLAKLKHERENIAWSPRAIRINGMRYSGPLDVHLLGRAICSGFKKKPSECEELTKKVNPFKEVWYKPEGGGGVGVGTFIGVLLGVVALVLVGLFVYKRSLTKSIHTSLREEVMLEVQAQMDQYKQLPS